MTKPKIVLSLFNDTGAVAYIENDMDSVEIVRKTKSKDSKKICTEAAKRLRSLAGEPAIHGHSRISKKPISEPTIGR